MDRADGRKIAELVRRAVFLLALLHELVGLLKERVEPIFGLVVQPIPQIDLPE